MAKRPNPSPLDDTDDVATPSAPRVDPVPNPIEDRAAREDKRRQMLEIDRELDDLDAIRIGYEQANAAYNSVAIELQTRISELQNMVHDHRQVMLEAHRQFLSVQPRVKQLREKRDGLTAGI